MKARRIIFTIATLTLLSCSFTLSAGAQEPSQMPSEGIDRVGLFDSLEKPVTLSDEASPSNVRTSQISVAELRQARALHQANQRRARLEYNLWMGIEPLRPRWNSLPMTSSRYPNHQLYVPVFVRTR